jgi:hypothetical protein
MTIVAFSRESAVVIVHALAWVIAIVSAIAR